MGFLILGATRSTSVSRLSSLVLLLAVVGCDPASSDPDALPLVTLRNANATTVHLLAAGETASAATELTSGATRHVSVASGARGEVRAFRLVRDGAEVEQIGCFLNNGIRSDTEVQHTAEGALVCLRW
jgi:hypothetical protein